jgi:hypothetical protein
MGTVKKEKKEEEGEDLNRRTWRRRVWRRLARVRVSTK